MGLSRVFFAEFLHFFLFLGSNYVEVAEIDARAQ